MTPKFDKIISQDRSHIDYIRDSFGVRVWKDKAQAIALSGSEWTEREAAKPLPLDPAFKNLPLGSAMQPVPALALEITTGSAELKQLVSGEISFADALDA